MVAIFKSWVERLLPTNHPYTFVDHESDETSPSKSKTIRGIYATWTSPRHANWHILALISLMTLVAVSILTIHPWARNQNTYGTIEHDHQQPRRNCGNSTSDAVKAGCSFDIMSFTWSLPECFDEELEADFLAYKKWSWWFDPEGKKPVPFEDVRAGRYTDLFVTWEYHLVHCTFMWRKMHNAIIAQRPIDSYIGNTNHTMHCSMELLDRIRGMNELNTRIRIKFPDCGVL